MFEKRIEKFGIVLVVLLASLYGQVARAGDEDEDEIVAGQIVARLVPNANVPAFLARYQITAIDSVVSQNIWLLSVPIESEEDFVNIIAPDPDVEWVEPNFTGRDVDPDPDTQSIFVASTFNSFDDQPSVNIIRLPFAQQYATGSGIVVAVLDSGLDVLHPLLAGSVVPGAWNFIDNNADVSDVGDGIDSNDNGVADELVGHGTLIAGLIHRVAPDAGILPIKVMDSDGLTTTFRLIEGIYHALDNGATIINISMGTTIDTTMLGEAMDAAWAQGVLIVASAGNNDTNDPVRFPAGYSHPGLLAVAATNNNDRRALFSNYGPFVSIAAPGVSITSTIPGGGYGRASGTSFSSPLVAGGAALIAERYQTGDPATIAHILQWASRDLDLINPQFTGQLGEGRIDLQRAMLRFPATGVQQSNGVYGPASRQRP